MNSMRYIALIAAIVIGAGSLLLFGLFLFGKSFSIIDLGFSSTGIHAWNSTLCLLFFIQHSTMIRKGFRRRLAPILPSHYHGALYSVASGVVLFLLVLLWQDSGMPLLSLQQELRWLAHAVFFASLIGMVWSVHVLRGFDMLGIRPLLAESRTSPPQALPLIVRGPYRWVRHPLYFCILLLIWCRPDLTAERLLFNVLFSIWIIIGTLLEERDLLADFGQVYEDYRGQVPMLIPWKLFK